MEQDTRPHWQVVSVQDTNIREASGMMVPGKRVNIVFVDGSHSMVEVPFTPGWDQMAKDAIDALAKEHASVMEMQGPPVTVQQRRPFVSR